MLVWSDFLLACLVPQKKEKTKQTNQTNKKPKLISQCTVQKSLLIKSSGSVSDIFPAILNLLRAGLNVAEYQVGELCLEIKSWKNCSSQIPAYNLKEAVGIVFWEWKAGAGKKRG